MSKFAPKYKLIDEATGNPIAIGDSATSERGAT